MGTATNNTPGKDEYPSAKNGLSTALSWLMKAIGIALAAFLICRTLKNTDADLASALKTASVPLLWAALACYGIVNLIAAWRWGILLKVQGIDIGLWGLFRLTLIGVFFSNVIPGSVSGDIIKMAYIMKCAPDKKSEAAFSIVVDRFLGLSGLFLVAMVSSLFTAVLYPSVLGNKTVLIAFSAVWAGGMAMLTAAIIAALRSRIMGFPICAKASGFFARRLPAKITSMILRFIAALDLYKDKPFESLKVLLLSALIHSILSVEIFLIGKAFHETVMSPIQYAITTQIGNATGLLPLTPGGIGIRDALTAVFLNLFRASPPEVMGLIPISFSLSIVFWALAGALFLVLSPIKNKNNPLCNTNLSS